MAHLRTRMPTYFLGIGGPNFLESTKHPAYAELTRIGQEITTRVRPKAVIVFSAHWQPDGNRIEVNVAENTDLIYDFHGFPAHFYAYNYPNKGSPEIAETVVEKLSAAGIEVRKIRRGLDHGVWAGFMVAFDPQKNPLKVPIVQVSLLGNEVWEEHYRLGQVMESFRDEGLLIIGAGMAVHNLHDFRSAVPGGNPMPYVFAFDEALKNATTAQPQHRAAQMSALMAREDARAAHPTLEHLLPMFVVVGAAGLDEGERLWTLPERSLSWAQYRFGAVPN